MYIRRFFKKVIKEKKAAIGPLAPFPISKRKNQILIYTQANSFIEPKLSKQLTGFRKNYNTQRSSKND